MAAARILQDIFSYIDGMPCPEGCGVWTARCDIGTEPACWLIVSDGERLAVTRAPVGQGEARPEAEMSAFYMTAKLFIREVRGQLSEQAQAAEFVKGRIRLEGDREKAIALAEVFHSLGPQLQQIANKSLQDDAQDADEEQEQPGFALRLLIAVVLLTRRLLRCLRHPLTLIAYLRGGSGATPHPLLQRDSSGRSDGGATSSSGRLSIARKYFAPSSLLLDSDRQQLNGRLTRESVCLSEESDMLTVEEALARLPWYRRHFGTDLLVASWLWLLGCGLYAVVSVINLAQAPTDPMLWFDLASSVIFVIGCVTMLYSSYPSSILKLAEELAKPPRPLSCFEATFTSNLMLLTTQLFILGTLPYMVEAALRIVESPAGSFESMLGMLMLFGLFALMPLLLFWSFIAMDFNLRKNNRRGSSYIFDFFSACPCCWRCGIKDKAFWRRHVGSDSLCTMWIMAVLACVGETLVLGKLILFPDLFTAFLAVDGAILTAGMLLMLHGVYPENFNSSSFFKEWVPLSPSASTTSESAATPVML